MVEINNLSAVPVVVSYWVNHTFIDKLLSQNSRIAVNEGTVGEWIIYSQNCKRLGKFRTSACASGDYCWMETDDVVLEYDIMSETCTIYST